MLPIFKNVFVFLPGIIPCSEVHLADTLPRGIVEVNRHRLHPRVVGVSV